MYYISTILSRPSQKKTCVELEETTAKCECMRIGIGSSAIPLQTTEESLNYL